MTTALAIWAPTTPAVRRLPVVTLQEPLVPRILDFLGRRERLLFAFLHISKRLLIEAGRSPEDVDQFMIQRPQVGECGHVRLWRDSCRLWLGRAVEMQLAEDEDLMGVVVPTSRRVDLESDRFTFYPDGWRELVEWCQRGCPLDDRDKKAARLRVQNVDVDRLVNLPPIGDGETFGRDELAPHKPDDAGPLFDAELPPISMDMEAELEGGDDDFVF